MADPAHHPELDEFDASTVRLYRAGLAISAGAVVLAGVVLLTAAGTGNAGDEVVRGWLRLAWIGLVYGTGASVSNLHLYDKRIRGALRGSAWIGVVLMLTGLILTRVDLGWWVLHAGVGFVLVTQSGLALKEQYCFRLPLMQAVPFLLAVGVFGAAMEAAAIAGTVLLAAGVLLVAMVVAKGRMPLHYDIGDKSRYQV